MFKLFVEQLNIFYIPLGQIIKNMYNNDDKSFDNKDKAIKCLDEIIAYFSNVIFYGSENK